MRDETLSPPRVAMPIDEAGWARVFEALPDEVRAAIEQGVAEDMRALAEEEAQPLATVARGERRGTDRASARHTP